MDEDRAAAAAYGRAAVPIGFEDNVVEGILPPERFVAGFCGQADGAVVAEGGGIVDPAEIWRDRVPDGEGAAGFPAVGANIDGRDAECAAGSGAVALALRACEARAAKGAGKAERTRNEYRARPVFTRADKAEAGKRAGRHGLARGRSPEFCRLHAGTGLVYST